RRVSQSALSSSPEEVRGLVACGTGAGVSIFANKFPGVFATTCLTPSDAVNARSINNSNVLAVSGRELNPIDLLPGGSMKIVRESPTSALVRFKAGSVEPAHHHTFGHDLVVIEGKKSVWNV
ncbi:DNA-damage-repair/toleration protein DRT102-like, partial [Trifolium medium]|nr:DNA-damage-repair/toleration protein DRT102-like [Trifolium medium]